MMEDFIVRDFLGRVITIYCGGIATFRGKVKDCKNGFVRLEVTQGRYTSIAIDKIITIKA